MGGTADAEKLVGTSAGSVPMSRQGSVSPTPSEMDIELLHYFDGTQSSLPPSARTDPTVKQRLRRPIGFLSLWKYIIFLVIKTFHLVSGFLLHLLSGPRRKTWGWQMTLITSFMRNANDHSHLADIAMLRYFINLLGCAPLPSDIIATPVTFRVRRRNLKGLLAESDSNEDGTRLLSGEWIVSRALRKRLQAEWKDVQGKPERRTTTQRRKDRVMLYIHGGAYYMFSAATHRQITMRLSKWTSSRVFAIDYRLAPECMFPGQLHDVVCAYMRLLDFNVPPENIVLAGDSAGGGLTLALLMYLRDNGYPLPSGAILFSPWVDLTMSCNSWETNSQFDIVCVPSPGDHLNPIYCYLGDNIQSLVTHPYASPLFGKFNDLPPILIQAGDSEVLRDEISLVAHKARVAGVPVRYELYEDGVHVFQQFPFLDIAKTAFRSCGDFIKNDIPAKPLRSGDKARFGTQSDAASNYSQSRAANDNDGNRTVRLSPKCHEVTYDYTRRARDDSGERMLDREYPRPSIRSSRTISHPDIASLCKDSEEADSRQRTISFFTSRKFRKKK